MMGKRFLSLACCFLFLGLVDAFGVEEKGSWKEGYYVSYVQKRELRCSGDNLYFINLDLEWPERLNGSGLQPLQTYLCKQLFRIDGVSLRPVCRQFLDGMGERLQAVPDEEGLATYYITCNLRVLSYDERGYISLRVFFFLEPKDASGQPVEYQRLVTYDLINERILYATDLLNTRMLSDLETRMTLVEMLYGQAYGEMDYNLEGLTLTLDACLAGNGVIFGLGQSQTGDRFHDLAILPSAYIEPLLTRNAKRLLQGEMMPSKSSRAKEAEKSSVVVNDEEVMPDSLRIHTAVDEMPNFTFGGQGISSYISKRMSLAPDMQPTGRAIVTFVVEKNGSLSDIAVLKSLSPELDRELVRTLRNMPRWKAGVLRGQPVRVQLVLPIHFQGK